MDMEIRDLNDETMAAYLCYGSGETPESVAGQREKLAWTQRMIPLGLGAKIAYREGKSAGYTNYLPIEVAPAPVEGTNALFIMCIMIPEEYRGQDIARALVGAVAEQAAASGLGGVATIGTGGHMPASVYEHLGFQTVDRHEDRRLMWKSLDDTPSPSLMKTTIEPTVAPDAVHIDHVFCSFCNCGGCMKELLEEFGDRVVLHEHRIDDRKTMDIHCGGLIDTLYIDGALAMNPPIGQDDWRRRITEALQRKGLSHKRS